MSTLRELRLTSGYRGQRGNALESFYIPCLRASTTYDRAVGYFSSGALAAALDGVSHFLARGGRIRIVASPQLTSTDLDAIERGYTEREVIEANIERAAREMLNELPREQCRLLRWLIAHDVLDIHIAIVKGRTRGIYHEKLGLFGDEQGNAVTFIGSTNETAAGLISNHESIEIFRSWVPGEDERTQRHRSEFELLWAKKDPDLEVFDFPEAARHVVLTEPDDDPDYAAFDGIREQGQEPASERVSLRPYQRAAIAAWLKMQGRGILEMATGTGKTITALSAAMVIARKYGSDRRPLAIVIVVPSRDLVVQWSKEAQKFGLSPLLCFHSRESWEATFRSMLAALVHGISPLFVGIATNATFSGDAFQSALRGYDGDVLLIVDEVHNVGSPQLRGLLLDRYRFRLGLSATPERWFDDAGTAVLLDYFGAVVFSLGLAEAIRIGALTPYRYYVHPIRLADDEASSYIELTDKIRAATGMADSDEGDGPQDDYIKSLMIRRATIIATARNKIPALMTLVQSDVPQRHTLVYCGTGRFDADDPDSARNVEEIAARLNDQYLRAAPYTAHTSSDAREALTRGFVAGEIQYLVAMRCLDEGIDIPAIRRAYFLASTTNPKQFIQRRGRALRPYPGKERAEIHDFLTMLSPEVKEEYQRSILTRELRRVKLFAELAENGPSATATLLRTVDPLYYFNA